MEKYATSSMFFSTQLGGARKAIFRTTNNNGHFRARNGNFQSSAEVYVFAVTSSIGE